MRSRGTALPQGCGSAPRPPCRAPMQADAHRTHTLAHSQTRNRTWANAPVQASKVAGTRSPHGTTEQTLLPLCPGFCPSAHPAPFSLPAPGSPLPRTLHLSSKHRTRVFSPFFNPALPLFLKNQALPPWPPHPLTGLSGPHLPKIHLQGPNNPLSVQCHPRRRPQSLRLLAWSTHETKANSPRLHGGNGGPERRRDLPRGPQGCG